jgi:hypothetical protein
MLRSFEIAWLPFTIWFLVSSRGWRTSTTTYKIQTPKWSSFFGLLSSMQEALSSSLAETDPMGEPGAETGEGQDEAQRSGERDRAKSGRERNANDTAGNVKAGKLWADQTTYVEEEPWTSDL